MVLSESVACLFYNMLLLHRWVNVGPRASLIATSDYVSVYTTCCVPVWNYASESSSTHAYITFSYLIYCSNFCYITCLTIQHSVWQLWLVSLPLSSPEATNSRTYTSLHVLSLVLGLAQLFELGSARVGLVKWTSRVKICAAARACF